MKNRKSWKKKTKSSKKLKKFKDLNHEIGDLQSELEEKKRELEKYKIYTDFLEDVINDDKDNKEFEDIDSLKNRFTNLRNENKKLIEKQNTINQQISKFTASFLIHTSIIIK